MPCIDRFRGRDLALHIDEKICDGPCELPQQTPLALFNRLELSFQVRDTHFALPMKQ
jgi:hypothetical protein